MDSEPEPTIKKLTFRVVLNALGQPLIEAEVLTEYGIFRGQSNQYVQEKFPKKLLKEIVFWNLNDYEALERKLPTACPIHSQALAQALFLASAAQQKFTFLNYIQKLAKREKQNIPAPIFLLNSIKGVDIYITCVIAQNLTDAIKQIVEFKQKLEKQEQIMEEANKKILSQTPPGKVEPITLEKYLDMLQICIKDSNIRFHIDLHYDTLMTEKGYNGFNVVMNKEDYVPYVNQLVKKYGIISIQNAYIDNEQIDVLQHIMNDIPYLRNERQIIDPTKFAISQLFEFLRTNRHKIVFDLRNVQTDDTFWSQVAIGANMEQILVGDIHKQTSWSKVNEMRRTEEGNEFIYGCEEWVVGI
ncbi:Conserved_hypothetical protein [Hexamita inflata]|uniref:Uncharacterized protein n=1 Tax=Hexamita inflata TaxID=28002 RepID=A0AA86QSR4_9EUKA|nr:Conserved hypothetical protein [Hexamita inflata]